MKERGKGRDVQSCEGTTFGGNLASKSGLMAHGARRADAFGAGFAFPPGNGVVNGLERKGPVRLLDVGRQTAQSVA